jgi:hypothetical protein
MLVLINKLVACLMNYPLSLKRQMIQQGTGQGRKEAVVAN